jgi:hypothetical protein
MNEVVDEESRLSTLLSIEPRLDSAVQIESRVRTPSRSRKYIAVVTSGTYLAHSVATGHDASFTRPCWLMRPPVAISRT